ncbi:probable pectinesterase/pectinesterase inhibitor 21 [Hibiscus syriacus]|uniref:probable pectinesterase/pectinesterase inhibitor 21 n=1 Tax=Hibiscus syriacus TaxID=106335 RepID=UPI001924F804|nr:probable pectinesterase/pectinesterase inhibitor 21 [Hibiscus syriacus]
MFGISVAVVVAVVVGMNHTSSKSNGNGDGRAETFPAVTSSKKELHALCQPVDYKKTCEQSLSQSNSTDTKELIRASFQAAVTEIKAVLSKSATIHELQTDEGTKDAFKVCQEVMGYAIDDLENSFKTLGEYDMTKIDDYLMNLKVWLSGAVTSQQTCIDSYEEKNGTAADKMRSLMNKSQELTSNSLHIVSGISSILKDLKIPGINNLDTTGLEPRDRKLSWSWFTDIFKRPNDEEIPFAKRKLFSSDDDDFAQWGGMESRHRKLSWSWFTDIFKRPNDEEIPFAKRKLFSSDDDDFAQWGGMESRHRKLSWSWFTDIFKRPDDEEIPFAKRKLFSSDDDDLAQRGGMESRHRKLSWIEELFKRTDDEKIPFSKRKLFSSDDDFPQWGGMEPRDRKLWWFVDIFKKPEDEIPVGLAKFNNRKLSSSDDDFPTWMNSGDRRLLQEADIKPNVVVAKYGSGKYDSINKALAEVPKNNPTRFVIYIKAGIYKEKVNITMGMANVMLIGDGPTKTVITGDLSSEVHKLTTFHTPTVAVNGKHFIAKNIGFDNTAGVAGQQAVALRSSGDMAAYYNCHFNGYQNTLFAHKERQYYRDCTISGTVDIIFGDGRSLFQNCQIIVRKPAPNQSCIITGHTRNDKKTLSAIVLQNCTISGDKDYLPVKDKNKAYLARPLKPYAITIIMQSQIDDIITPEGYTPMNGTVGLDTSFYAEIDNRGTGAKTEGRVKWGGIKHLDLKAAKKYTPRIFLESETWIPLTGIPCNPDLIQGMYTRN